MPSVVELFAGAGGMALGFEKAGFESKMLVEWSKHAADTLKKNRPNWNVINGDVRDIDFKGIEADVVAGGFPCQAFTTIGKRLGFQDIRGTLFFEMARAIKDIRPKYVVGENVTGLMQHDKGKTIDTILNVLEEFGYHCDVRIMDSSKYDVPQIRKRVIIVGMRDDYHYWPPTPIGKVIPLSEALKDVPAAPHLKFSKKMQDIMELIPAGGNWKNIPDGLREEYVANDVILKTGCCTGMARRLSWARPSPTVVCSPIQKRVGFCHPDEVRPLTVREYARIQTFPDDWEFCGPLAEQYKQIGNAVPVNLAWHIGKALVEGLEGRV